MNKLYLLTSFICGAIVMILEIVGTRILSPFFGSGLFVWSSSIIVAMLGLSVGYYLGGQVADNLKEKLDDRLYLIILISSILVLLSPDFSRVIYYFYEIIDIKISTFLSCLILLFAPLVGLGMVSPIVLKLISKEYSQVGKDLGFIYSISTIGSLVGALLAGFVLLQFLGAMEVFYYSALTLCLISLTYFSLSKKYIYLVVLVLFGVFYNQGSKPLVNSDKVSITTLEKKDTFYGRVDVVEVKSNEDKSFNQRIMLLDGMPQGAIDNNSGKSVFLYHHYIESIIESLNSNKKNQDLLFVGVGAGLMPKNLSSNNKVTSVDINPVVADFAKKYFHLKQDVVIEDGRVFLNQTKKNFDVIIIDVFAGETIPNHLLTVEFMGVMKSRLAKDGYAVFNLIGNPYEGMEGKSILKTINKEFKEVKIFPLKDKNVVPINYVVVASNIEIKINENNLFNRISEKLEFNKPLSIKFAEEGLPLIDDMSLYQDGDVLTDNFNKIDFYSMNEKKEIRKHLAGFLLTLN